MKVPGWKAGGSLTLATRTLTVVLAAACGASAAAPFAGEERPLVLHGHDQARHWLSLTVQRRPPQREDCISTRGSAGQRKPAQHACHCKPSACGFCASFIIYIVFDNDQKTVVSPFSDHLWSSFFPLPSPG